MTFTLLYQTLLIFLPFIKGQLSPVPTEHLQSTQIQPQQLNISIYYEGLCPDSRMFITETFPPVYKLFSEYLNVRFIPFGKASIKDDGSEYQCQHGKEECIRNIIHGCALDTLPKGGEQFEFVYCAMINKSLQGQRKCVQERNLSWENIQNCVNGERGLELTLQAQQDTRISTGGPAFVPTIIFNNQFSQENQEIAFTNPKTVICKYLVGHPHCSDQQQYYIAA